MVRGLSSPLGLGILFGLLAGKPLGITLFSYLSVKLGMSSLPSRSTWKHVIGLGMLAGIGFTMSVFIALLSFDNVQYHDEAKFSILVTSLLAGIAGYWYLSVVYRKRVKKVLESKPSLSKE
jgi:NhaA family Na+:H+ antiporter